MGITRRIVDFLLRPFMADEATSNKLDVLDSIARAIKGGRNGEAETLIRENMEIATDFQKQWLAKRGG